MDWDYTQISDFYERVRGLLNDTSVTDSKMDAFEKAPTAERVIKTLVPTWESFDTSGEKFKIFESCIVYQTAIYFENYVMQRQVKKRETPSINIEYSTSSTKQGNILSLKDMLESLLTELSDTTTSRFNAFMVT